MDAGGDAGARPAEERAAALHASLVELLKLAALGLSSLGRCEGHVRDTLSRLCAWLSGERAKAMTIDAGEPLDWSRAERILHANTRALADIIGKMETHQYKKGSLYRPLGIARTGN